LRGGDRRGHPAPVAQIVPDVGLCGGTILIVTGGCAVLLCRLPGPNLRAVAGHRKGGGLSAGWFRLQGAATSAAFGGHLDIGCAMGGPDGGVRADPVSCTAGWLAVMLPDWCLSWAEIGSSGPLVSA
jgi:hypothetical protein